jgi:monovalent cation:H+ antiporter, CPA1 family
LDFTFSLGLAIGGYVVADHFLHVSGVFTAIPIVTTHKEISGGVRKLFHKYWDYLGFVSANFVVLPGIPLLSVESYESTKLSRVAILGTPFVIMMLSRAFVVYGRSTFLRISRVKIPLQWQNILILGGKRRDVRSISSHYL